jgi:uncharacterized protein
MTDAVMSDPVASDPVTNDPDMKPEPVHREQVPGGRYWSMVVRRGFTLRMTDIDGRANVAMLLFNPDNLTERYNMSDTLKAQHTAMLTRGNMLYSDMGRVMMSIVEDTLGWHDTIGGISTSADVVAQYGESSYQSHRNAFFRSGRELFLIELGKWSLGCADLVPNVNCFSCVRTSADGELQFVPGHSRPGARIALRADMDTLVVLNTAPHPMDPAATYAPGAVELAIVRSDRFDPDTDYCVSFRPENARAFANTAIYNCQRDAGGRHA